MDASGEQTVDGGDEDDDDEFGDDFDDFEEGDEDADFGDFDDGFQQAEEDAPAPPPVGVPPSVSVPSFVRRSFHLHSMWCWALGQIAYDFPANIRSRRSRFRGRSSSYRTLSQRIVPTRFR